MNNSMQEYLFNVAGHIFAIEAESAIPEILPNLKPFITQSNAEPLFSITVDDSIEPEWKGNRIGEFPCPSATFEVYKEEKGAYRILVSDEKGVPCAFIQSDDAYRQFTVTTRGTDREREFGLNNSIMVIYTLCSASHNTLLIHSSVVENNGKAYMFLGASGRGKSTHSNMWTEYISGTTLINDDNPVIRIDADGAPIVYGSPWSGKRPIYINVHYPIGGIAAIEQAKENRITKESIPTAFSIMLSSCSTLKFDKQIHMHVCGTISRLLECIPIHTLFCRPDREAALTSSKAFGL